MLVKELVEVDKGSRLPSDQQATGTTDIFDLEQGGQPDQLAPAIAATLDADPHSIQETEIGTSLAGGGDKLDELQDSTAQEALQLVPMEWMNEEGHHSSFQSLATIPVEVAKGRVVLQEQLRIFKA